ncbi:hypothetical protein LDK02_11575 [Fusobacterium animalis]|uniref:hypothetical protein n=1 Tax=Fusobacterium animalis TaxID=76859 RepID=UPI0030D24326
MKKDKLVSYALMTELSNKNKSILDVLNEFIKSTIFLKKLEEFKSEEILEYLFEIYTFEIPKSVIELCLKKLTKIKILEKKKNLYKVIEINKLNDILKEYSNLEEEKNTFINLLKQFISEKLSKEISFDETSKFLYDYICENKIDRDIQSQISSFLLSNKENFFNIKNIYSKIYDGVYFYNGIAYIEINQIGHWDNEMNIILDTEILLDSFGYNGDILKKEFDFFINFVKDVNKKKKKIFLQYFNKTLDEIESIFDYIENNFNMVYPLNKIAFYTIKNKAKNKNEIKIEKARFKNHLKSLDILMTDEIDITEKKNYKYNLISEEKINDYYNKYSFKDKDKDKIEETLTFLTKILIFRQDKEIKFWEKCKCIFVTRNFKTLQISYDESKERKIYPLALPLGRIINLLWFKLNKGFAIKKDFSNFKAITKTEIILRNITSSKINEIMEETEKKLKNKEINEDIMGEVIADLKNKEIELLENNGYCPTEDFLLDMPEDYIDRVIKEKEKREQRIEELERQNKELLNDKEKLKIYEETEKNKEIIKNKMKKWLFIGLRIILILTITFLIIYCTLKENSLFLKIVGIFTNLILFLSLIPQIEIKIKKFFKKS